MYQLDQIEEVVFKKAVLKLPPEAMKRVTESYEFLSGFAENRVIYGINTGFGPMAQYRVQDTELKKLQYNIIRSHSCGAGEAISCVYVRAALLSRMVTFLSGMSGVHPDVIRIMTDFLNHEIYPVIPQHGSVGASGDLVQLAHMALAFIGEGEVFWRGVKVDAKTALEGCNVKPLEIYLREGLALTNGTAMMTGIGAVNTIRAKRLLEYSVATSCMMNEVAASYDDFMSEVLNDAKNHYGQKRVAALMRELTRDSGRLLKREDKLYDKDNNGEPVFTHKVQPFYSLRCVPQILGPVLETIDNVERVIVEEFNSVDDNPIVDRNTHNVFHGGNFHGDYVSLEMDKLKIAVTKMTMLAERQMNYLFNDKVNEVLPPFLNMANFGLDYAFQAAQFTATSTTAECQTLSNPMYVHSIPNNNDNQDIVSMGTNSAQLAAKVIENSRQVMAIHLLALAQAVDCLGISDRLSAVSAKLYKDVRGLSAAVVEDRALAPDIAAVQEYIENNKLGVL